MGVTIKDIAQEAGVSITTVSRVLNNKPDVSPKTKEEVQQVINRLGYNPNGIARGLVLQKTHTIGLVIPDISNPFFPEVARGIENQAKELGYSVIFCNTDNDKQGEQEAIELMKGKQVDGIILSLAVNQQNKKELTNLAKDDFPVVQIDRKIPGADFPAVVIDNVSSAYKATNYLIELGYEKLAHISGDLEVKTSQDRLQGFKTALSEAKISYNEDWILEGDYSQEAGYQKMKDLLDQDEIPQAIFIANDLMALGAYQAILEEGLNIPEDISIIGHDDIDIASIIRPTLTTMSQPTYNLGQLASEILIKQIEGQESLKEPEVVLEPELVIRDSTKEGE